MQPQPPSCSRCANFIDNRCHGLPPRPSDLRSQAVFPVIPDPDHTVCRGFTTTDIGAPAPGPEPPPWPPWPDWPPFPPIVFPGPRGRSTGRSTALLTAVVSLTFASGIAVGVLALTS